MRGLANFFYKMVSSKYFRLVGQMVSPSIPFGAQKQPQTICKDTGMSVFPPTCCLWMLRFEFHLIFFVLQFFLIFMSLAVSRL